MQVLNCLEHTNLIPHAINKKVLFNKDGSTRDIINEVLQTYSDARNQLQAFAVYFKEDNLVDTCSNIWHFWKEQVHYKVDPEGVQWIKTPAAFWDTHFGDCKSFSIAVGASLHALNIPFAFRFVSFGSNVTNPTHVYVVVPQPGQKEIIIDCVWKEFNSQKSFSKNWDFPMTAIYQISGIDTDNGRTVLDLPDNIGDLTEGELDLLVHKQQLEIEQMIAAKRSGIGSTHDNAYELEIMATHNAIAEIAGKTRGAKKSIKKVVGKAHAGAPKKRVSQVNPKKSKKVAKAIKRNAAGKGINKRDAKRLKDLNIVVKKKKEGLLKKVGKFYVKAITAPFKGIAQLALKVTLPKNAPFFLYLFLDDPKDPVRSAKILAQVPEAVKTKYAKALKTRSLIVDKIKMKPSTFDKIIRNGIMKRYMKSPEAVLAQWMQDSGFQVSGVLEIAGKGINLLIQKLTGSVQEDLENFTPTPEDWGDLDQPTKEKMAKEVEDSSNNNDVNSGKGSVKNQSEDQIIKDAEADAKLYDQAANDPSVDPGTGDDEPAGDMANVKVMQPVNVTAPKKSSSMAPLVLGGLGLFALMSMKPGK